MIEGNSNKTTYENVSQQKSKYKRSVCVFLKLGPWWIISLRVLGS